MAEYYLTPEAVQVGQRATLTRLLLLAAALLAGGFYYSHWVLQAETVVTLPFYILVVVTFTYSYLQNTKQQKLTLESYRLLVEPDRISRFSASMPPLQLVATDITAITQYAQGALAITTADKYRAIYVPAQVTNRPELLRELTRFAPLTIVANKTWGERLMPFVSVGMIGLMGLFYLVNNKVVSTITGILLLGILSWSGWHLWRNENLLPQARRVRWFLPIIFLSILLGIIARLVQ